MFPQQGLYLPCTVGYNAPFKGTLTASVCAWCPTCCHVDEHTLARPHVGHLKQHHVGGHVVNGESRALLKAHLLGHGEGVDGGHDNEFLPHAAAP